MVVETQARDPREDEANPSERVPNPFEVPGRAMVAVKGAMVEAEMQRAVAEVQAAMMIARANPRDPVRAMDMILNDCTRLSLAENATYEYVRGGVGIYGPNIRLTETMARRWGNIECGVRELARHEGYSDCLAYAWDLETNYREVKSFQIKHWRDTKQGGYVITDERDIYELVANMGARRKRACILAVLPGDLVESAVDQCEKTLANKVDITPEKISSMVDKFKEFGVTKDMIEKKIQRRVDTISAPLMVRMGKVYNSLKDGMSVAADHFDVQKDDPEEKTPRGRKRPQAKKDAKAEDPKVDPKALATDSELKFLRGKLKAAEITEAELCKAFQIGKLEELKGFLMPAAQKWITDPTGKPELNTPVGKDG